MSFLRLRAGGVRTGGGVVCATAALALGVALGFAAGALGAIPSWTT